MSTNILHLKPDSKKLLTNTNKHPSDHKSVYLVGNGAFESARSLNISGASHRVGLGANGGARMIMAVMGVSECSYWQLNSKLQSLGVLNASTSIDSCWEVSI